jgi:hypothetical protein
MSVEIPRFLLPTTCLLVNWFAHADMAPCVYKEGGGSLPLSRENCFKEKGVETTKHQREKMRYKNNMPKPEETCGGDGNRL